MTQIDETDPRPLYDRALSWVHGLLANVGPEQLTNPTPCSEYDTRALAGHLVTTVERARMIGEGGDVYSVPVVTTGFADDRLADAYAGAVAKMWAVWRDSPGADTLLDRSMKAPWGTTSGRVVLHGYVNETLVHGWDLAVATGQDCEADPGLAEAALAMTTSILPATPRGGDVPFAPPVEPAPDAGPTERLANWCGHARP